jgi:hypothetical protein
MLLKNILRNFKVPRNGKDEQEILLGFSYIGRLCSFDFFLIRVSTAFV